MCTSNYLTSIIYLNILGNSFINERIPNFWKIPLQEFPGKAPKRESPLTSMMSVFARRSDGCTTWPVNFDVTMYSDCLIWPVCVDPYPTSMVHWFRGNALLPEYVHIALKLARIWRLKENAQRDYHTAPDKGINLHIWHISCDKHQQYNFQKWFNSCNFLKMTPFRITISFHLVFLSAEDTLIYKHNEQVG